MEKQILDSSGKCVGGIFNGILVFIEGIAPSNAPVLDLKEIQGMSQNLPEVQTILDSFDVQSQTVDNDLTIGLTTFFKYSDCDLRMYIPCKPCKPSKTLNLPISEKILGEQYTSVFSKDSEVLLKLNVYQQTCLWMYALDSNFTERFHINPDFDFDLEQLNYTIDKNLFLFEDDCLIVPSEIFRDHLIQYTYVTSLNNPSLIEYYRQGVYINYFTLLRPATFTFNEVYYPNLESFEIKTNPESLVVENHWKSDTREVYFAFFSLISKQPFLVQNFAGNKMEDAFLIAKVWEKFRINLGYYPRKTSNDLLTQSIEIPKEFGFSVYLEPSLKQIKNGTDFELVKYLTGTYGVILKF